MPFSDSFHDTGSTALTSHVPTRISDNSSEAGLSYAAAESTGGAIQILSSGIGCRNTSGSTGHVLSNVATPTSTFTDTCVFKYRTGGNTNSNIGGTAFDNGLTGGSLTCYQVRLNVGGTTTCQIVRIVSGSGSVGANYTLTVSDNDIITFATTYTITSSVAFSIDIKVNGSTVTTLTYTDSSPISASGTFLGIRADGPNNSDTTGALLLSRDVPLAGPSDPFITVSPSTSATGGGNITYTLTGSNTAWTGGTTATISGGTGASIVSQGISGQVITAVVNIGTAAGTLTFGNTDDAGTGTTAVTLGLPGAPTSLSGTPGNNQVALTWTAPASGGTVATYNLYRGTTSNGESATAVATGIATTSYTNTGLTNGQAYYFKVKAVNATGLSSYSTEAGPYTPVAAPFLTLTESKKAVLDSGTVSLTGTVTNTNGNPLAASVSGGGTLSTAVPTSGTPFTYTAPSSSTGTATVTLSGGGAASPVTQTIFYGPDSDWAEVYLSGATASPVTCQIYDLSGSTVGPQYGPLTALEVGDNEFGTTVILPDTTNIYRVVFDDGNGGHGVYISRPMPDVDLKSTGLDNLSATSPTAVATTFAQKLLQVWDRHFGKVVKNNNDDTIKLMQGSGSTPATTQTFTSSGGIDTINLSS